MAEIDPKRLVEAPATILLKLGSIIDALQAEIQAKDERIEELVAGACPLSDDNRMCEYDIAIKEKDERIEHLQDEVQLHFGEKKEQAEHDSWSGQAAAAGIFYLDDEEDGHGMGIL